ncbi:hypothetical protein Ancab_013140 [Ancistrocladus abbreviatus]
MQIKVVEHVFSVRVSEESFFDGNFWMQSDYAHKPQELVYSSSLVSVDFFPISSVIVKDRRFQASMDALGKEENKGWTGMMTL